MLILSKVDLEKLAEYLEQLQEDDLLQAIQMIHDNKTSDMYVKNDMEREFDNSREDSTDEASGRGSCGSLYTLR